MSDIKNQNAKTAETDEPTGAEPMGAEPIGEMRQAERRRKGQRREGVRGLWEERRLFDRRGREYSMFGKRFDGSDDEETDVSKVPDVADELLISPAEIEIFRQQDEQAESQKSAISDETQTPRRNL